MTSAIEAELATVIDAIGENDEHDGPMLQAIAQRMRETSVELDPQAEYLEALARRFAVRIESIAKLRRDGVLDETSNDLRVTDLEPALAACPTCGRGPTD